MAPVAGRAAPIDRRLMRSMARAAIGVSDLAVEAALLLVARGACARLCIGTMGRMATSAVAALRVRIGLDFMARRARPGDRPRMRLVADGALVVSLRRRLLLHRVASAASFRWPPSNVLRFFVAGLTHGVSRGRRLLLLRMTALAGCGGLGRKAVSPMARRARQIAGVRRSILMTAHAIVLRPVRYMARGTVGLAASVIDLHISVAAAAQSRRLLLTVDRMTAPAARVRVLLLMAARARALLPVRHVARRTVLVSSLPRLRLSLVARVARLRRFALRRVSRVARRARVHLGHAAMHVRALLMALHATLDRQRWIAVRCVALEAGGRLVCLRLVAPLAGVLFDLGLLSEWVARVTVVLRRIGGVMAPVAHALVAVVADEEAGTIEARSMAVLAADVRVEVDHVSARLPVIFPRSRNFERWAIFRARAREREDGGEKSHRSPEWQRLQGSSLLLFRDDHPAGCGLPPTPPTE
jgi:hypothetical protein